MNAQLALQSAELLVSICCYCAFLGVSVPDLCFKHKAIFVLYAVLMLLLNCLPKWSAASAKNAERLRFSRLAR